MQLHEVGLPFRVPSEDAVRGVFSRGQHYDLRVREGKQLHISLTEVRVTKPGRPSQPLTEELVARMLTVVALAKHGETYRHPDSGDATPEELDAGDNSGHVIMSQRSARVITRLLAVRALMRAELGM
jgi:hypothetical protein